MTKKISETNRLGEIVSIFPGASKLFNKYKIDYCCGGDDILKDALDKKELTVEKIVDELNAQYQVFLDSNTAYVDWRNEKPTELIDHIIETHHHFTKQTVTQIDELMFKILQVHFSHHQEELLEVHRLFGLLKIEIQQHLVKEEENLFPLIQQYEYTKDETVLKQIKQFIKETEDEHDAAGDLLKQIEEVTNDFTAPENSCNTYRIVYAMLSELEKDLFNHIYLENSVLFNMF